MSQLKAVMLVSAHAGLELRAEVEMGLRPCPDFLRLEQRFDVSLLDWTRLGVGSGGRSPSRSLRHVAAALRELDRCDVVLSDGEHVGIPLAMAMAVRRAEFHHVMIGHQLVTRPKAPFFTLLRVQHRIDRVIVHSRHHLEVAHERLGISRSKLRLVPYGVDTNFWRPADVAEERLVVASGRDHRDFTTLARSCHSLNCRVFLTLASLHSAGARALTPTTWPNNFDHAFLDYVGLRRIYARASVVVVPMMRVDFPAGITSLLEAMAMSKAVVVSASPGLAGIVEDGETGVIVPPGDPDRMRDAISWLLERPAERARLGANARQAAVERFNLDVFSRSLAAEMKEVTGATGRELRPCGLSGNGTDVRTSP